MTFVKSHARRGAVPLTIRGDLLAAVRGAREEADADARLDVPSSLLEWVPVLTPTFVSPTPLAPFAEVLDRILAGERIRCVMEGPPRHGKTELFLHWIPQVLRKHPDWPLMYLAYGSKLAWSKSARARTLARDAGITLSRDSSAKYEWLTDEGGGLRAAGVGDAILGHGAQVLMLDDPHKNRREAESGVMREAVWAWFTSTAMSRLEPHGSAVIFMQRWHEDDVAGRAVSKLGWERIRLPALSDDGRALWPERYDVEALEQIRARSEYDWQSLYQCDPRPRSGRLFADAILAQHAPAVGTRVIGIDLAHTARTRADYTAIVVLLRAEDGSVTVIDAERLQARLVDEVRDGHRIEGVSSALSRFAARYPGSRMVSYTAARETTTYDLLAELGDGRAVHVEPMKVGADKWVRAQGWASAWNDGRVRVLDRPWADDYVREHAEFTGADGCHDDFVDASAAAFDALAQVRYGSVQGVGGRMATAGMRRRRYT